LDLTTGILNVGAAPCLAAPTMLNHQNLPQGFLFPHLFKSPLLGGHVGRGSGARFGSQCSSLMPEENAQPSRSSVVAGPRWTIGAPLARPGQCFLAKWQNKGVWRATLLNGVFFFGVGDRRVTGLCVISTPVRKVGTDKCFCTKPMAVCDPADRDGLGGNSQLTI